MAKLYPPIIEGTIPAFYGDSITIPFSMNKVVSNSEVYGVLLKIKTVQNNRHLGELKITFNSENREWIGGSLNKENGLAVFNFSSNEKFKLEEIKVGQYYKVQLAFIDKHGEIGYFSTVGVVKKTTQPEVGIQLLEKGVRNQALETYIGYYRQDKTSGDWTEKVYTYNFKIWDLNNNIIADSGELLHIRSNDELAYESTDSFVMIQELTQNSTYYIQYTVTTTGGMVVSQKYRLSPKQSVLPELNAELHVSLNTENGYVDVTLQGEVVNKYEKTANGSFLLTRRKEEEPGKWEELVRFGLRGEKPSTWSWKDFTVEQGVNYIYSIQQYSNNLFSQRITSRIYNEKTEKWIDSPIYVDFEHAFLFDGEKQLKIKYNPKVSSFKTMVLESKVETLGSKHPFIFRNGHVSYKDFPISGLISYLMDEENLFIGDNVFSGENLIRKPTDSSVPRNNFKIKHTNLTSDNIQRERNFKLAVLDWLNNGEPKLFRSPGEGNYIVRLMNNSLSPNDTLGRMLHTFSSNAYEIADYNYENLSYYGFIRNKEGQSEDRKVIHWATIETLNLLPKEPIAEYTQNILPNEIHVNELNIYGMLPGDKIRIKYVDGNNLDIIIGATGAYSAANIAPISSVELWGANAKVDGMITYSYETTYSNTFGLYNNAISKEIPAKQVFGLNTVGINIRTILEDLKTSVLNVYYMKFEKRPVQAVYADAGKDIVVTNQVVDITKSNLYYDRYKTQPVIFSELDPYTIYQVYLSALDKDAPIQHNQDYFLDNNQEKFFPTGEIIYTIKDKAYIDGRTQEIFSRDLYSTKVYINPQIDEKANVLEQLKLLKGIDINETEEYVVEDLRPDQLFIGAGVMLTIGYCVSFVTYNFETEERYLSKEKKDAYDMAEKKYKETLVKYSNNEANESDIDMAINVLNLAYVDLLHQIQLDLAVYKEEHGLLGEDE